MAPFTALTIVAGSLLAAAAAVAEPPLNGTAPAERGVRALALSEFEPAWTARVAMPLVDRLRPLGRYEPVNLPADEIAGLIADRPDSLGLMRRSGLPQDALARGEITYVEVGPAACLVLAVAPDAPWKSYADLNYVAPTHRLKVAGVSAEDLATFMRITQHFPLRATLAQPVRQPLRIAVAQLLAGAVDVLAFEVARPGRTFEPPESLAEVTGLGARLLEMPTTLGPPAAEAQLVVDEVPLVEPTFWRDGKTYPTFCDAFVMVFDPAFADDLAAGLHGRPAQTQAVRAEDGGGFGDRIADAATSFVAMLQRWL